MSNIFKFAKADTLNDFGAGNGAAPKLLHVGSADNSLADGSSETYVDVLREFPWTNSPAKAIEESPYIDLVESRITQNPMLNQMATHFAVLNNFGDNATVDESTKAEIQAKITQQMDAIESGSDMSFIDAAKTAGGSLARGKSSHVLNNYTGLYTTVPTGWRYRLPYYTDSYKQLVNGFTDNKGQAGGGIGGSMLDIGKQVSDIAAQAGKLKTVFGPGSYIETSKFFNFDGREKTYQFNFPLSNSIHSSKSVDQLDVIRKNWQFIYLLIYQNNPNRYSRDLVSPPCIYEAKVPGVFYSRYAYISNINIDFIGNRRMMAIDVPQYDPTAENNNSMTTIQTVVPDVYGVTISVTELHGESQNMLAHLVDESSLITVS